MVHTADRREEWGEGKRVKDGQVKGGGGREDGWRDSKRMEEAEEGRGRGRDEVEQSRG